MGFICTPHITIALNFTFTQGGLQSRRMDIGGLLESLTMRRIDVPTHTSAWHMQTMECMHCLLLYCCCP